MVITQCPALSPHRPTSTHCLNDCKRDRTSIQYGVRNATTGLPRAARQSVDRLTRQRSLPILGMGSHRPARIRARHNRRGAAGAPDGDTERGGIGRTSNDATRRTITLTTQHSTRVDKRGESQPNKSRATTGRAIAARSKRRQEATSREPPE